jgi:hypothetical protein
LWRAARKIAGEYPKAVSDGQRGQADREQASSIDSFDE